MIAFQVIFMYHFASTLYSLKQIVVNRWQLIISHVHSVIYKSHAVCFQYYSCLNWSNYSLKCHEYGELFITFVDIFECYIRVPIIRHRYF